MLAPTVISQQSDLRGNAMSVPLHEVYPALCNAPLRLRPLAVNAFTLVLVVDPTSAEGLILIDMLYQMWKEYYPIRIGKQSYLILHQACWSEALLPG
jgi:hypothetical protein